MSNPAFTFPARMSKLLTQAEDAGWTLYPTFAHVEGKTSVAIRFHKDEQRAYAIWHHSTGEDDKESVRWGWGGSATPLTPFPTLGAFTAYLIPAVEEVAA